MFKNTKKLFCLLIIIIPIILTGCSSVPKVEWELTISGEVTNPVTYTFDDLANMEMIDLNEVYMERSHGEDEIRSFSGISLAALLEAAGAIEDYSTLTAIAGDGYAIEISNDETADGIVAMKQSGNWIVDEDPDAGPIRLVFPLTPANRWVFQIQEIIVNP